MSPWWCDGSSGLTLTLPAPSGETMVVMVYPSWVKIAVTVTSLSGMVNWLLSTVMGLLSASLTSHSEKM